MANWSSLPCDLISEIALKLDVEDYVYFSSVCRSFHRACSMVKRKWGPKIPWLLLAENANDNPDCRRKVYSLSSEKCYELKLPQTFGTRCWGSSCGWVVTLDLNRQLYLFNPLTNAHISLPSQSTMSNQAEFLLREYDQADFDQAEFDTKENQIEDEYREYTLYIRKYFVSKAIVFEDAHGSHLVLAIHGRNYINALALARPGDNKWTNVVTTQTSGVADVCCDGRRIYVLFVNGNLGYFEISEAQGSKPVSVVDCSNIRPPPIERCDTHYHKLYIVKSFGDLLVVIRYKIDLEKGGSYTSNIEVYRLNFVNEEWEQMNDLGDVSLFVGTSHSLSVRASTCGNLISNSIYYSDDLPDWWNSVHEYDMGVFRMASREFEEFCDEDMYNKAYTPSLVCSPLWFVPRL